MCTSIALLDAFFPPLLSSFAPFPRMLGIGFRRFRRMASRSWKIPGSSSTPRHKCCVCSALDWLESVASLENILFILEFRSDLSFFGDCSFKKPTD